MKPAHEENPAATGSEIAHQQTFIPDADTQQFLSADERPQDTVKKTVVETVDRICRNCGQELASVTQDICSNWRACERRAPFAMPRMRALENDVLPEEQGDTSWSAGMLERYAMDPRMQLALDSVDIDTPPHTKAPNLISVMRSLAAGAIEEADPVTKERARRFCIDFHGV